MNNEIFINLKSLVITQSAVKDELITRDTSIEDDLGLTGDDAVDFLIAYSKTFDVDVTKFMAADYFGPERSVVLSELFREFTGKRKRKILTVGHLEKGIIAGRLDENVIEYMKQEES